MCVSVTIKDSCCILQPLHQRRTEGKTEVDGSRSNMCCCCCGAGRLNGPNEQQSPEDYSYVISEKTLISPWPYLLPHIILSEWHAMTLAMPTSGVCYELQLQKTQETGSNFNTLWLVSELTCCYFQQMFHCLHLHYSIPTDWGSDVIKCC